MSHPKARKKSRAAATPAQRYRAPALDKGLQILAHLAGRGEPASNSEIASALGYARSEIYRMLLVLEARGFIKRNEPDGRYVVTERLFDLGMSHVPKRSLHTAALPVMEDLSNATLQSCHLGVLSGTDMVVVARVESPGPVSFAVKLGYRVPLVDSTSGRVILAFQPPGQQTAWLADIKRASRQSGATDNLLADAQKIAKRGYALEPSRLSEGVRDIGAPILDSGGRAIASLTMPFITHRYLEMDVAKTAEKVVAAAKEISRRLHSA